MSITIELPAQEIAALKQVTNTENDAAAVVQAAREFLRLCRLRELKTASGRVDFDANWPQLEKMELSETALPQ